jgi:hypothetical protein
MWYRLYTGSPTGGGGDRMLRASRLAALVVVTGALAAGITQTGSAATANIAKTVKYSASCAGHVVGATTIRGTCHGTFGKCPYKVTASPPQFTTTEGCRGGSFTFTGTGTVRNNRIETSWHLIKGSGKFKGAKGHGTLQAYSKNGTNYETEQGTFSLR